MDQSEILQVAAEEDVNGPDCDEEGAITRHVGGEPHQSQKAHVGGVANQ